MGQGLETENTLNLNLYAGEGTVERDMALKLSVEKSYLDLAIIRKFE